MRNAYNIKSDGRGNGYVRCKSLPDDFIVIRRLTMTNKTYDLIRLIGEIAVPVIAFVTAICTIWNVPRCAEVTATLTALDTLIGAVVMILRGQYNKRLKE